MTKLYEVKLSLEQLKQFDGVASEEIQKIIDLAKKENSFGFDLPLMNEILRRSEEIGLLTWRYKDIRSCDHCDKNYDYYRYPRSGKYHSKGEKNHNKPKYYRGIKFNEGFVTIQGYGDMCVECSDKHNIINKLIDYILDNDIKIEIQKNDYRVGKYLKDDIKVCWNCNEEMRESEMGLEPAVMSGHYPSKCPKCEAKSSAFGKSHKSTNKFDFTLNPAALDEISSIRAEIKKYNKSLEDEKQKLALFQSSEKKHVFFVKLSEGHYGGRLVIDTIQKKYHSNDKYDQFTSFLTLYEKAESEYFYF